jgi:hypothetical protein
MHSPETKRHVDPERLQQCFWLMLEQQGLSDREPPKVLVLHVSEAEAAVAGIRDSVQVKSVGVPGRIYYQVWLVDEVKPAQYMVAFQAIIRQVFGLNASAVEEAAILTRVLKVQDATISAKQRSAHDAP